MKAINLKTVRLAGLGNSQKKLGGKICTLREQQALTQEQLAEACAITSGDVAKLEAEELDVTIRTLVRLAQRLGITVEHLLEGI